MHRTGKLRTPALPEGHQDGVAGGAREEQTPAEAKLWAYLRMGRTDGISFRRQHATAEAASSRHRLVWRYKSPNTADSAPRP